MHENCLAIDVLYQKPNATMMKGNRLPAVALYGPVDGTKSRRKQPRKWMNNNVKEDLKAQGINMRNAVDNSRSRNRKIW